MSVDSDAIVDGTIQAVDLAASAVLEPGIEFLDDPATNLNPVQGPQTAASISVAYPGAGYILASATGQISCSAAQLISVDIATGTTLTESWTFNPPIGGFTWVDRQEVFPVGGAGTTTLNFLLELFSADNCTYFRALDFTAIWVPVRY